MTADLTPDFTLNEVAKALGMSPRWLRDRIKFDKVEHLRYGHKIRFTAEQVEKLRSQFTVAPAPTSTQVTTGRKKR